VLLLAGGEENRSAATADAAPFDEEDDAVCKRTGVADRSLSQRKELLSGGERAAPEEVSGWKRGAGGMGDCNEEEPTEVGAVAEAEAEAALAACEVSVLCFFAAGSSGGEEGEKVKAGEAVVVEVREEAGTRRGADDIHTKHTAAPRAKKKGRKGKDGYARRQQAARTDGQAHSSGGDSEGKGRKVRSSEQVTASAHHTVQHRPVEHSYRTVRARVLETPKRPARGVQRKGKAR
jgi:hypothetical protein